MNIKTLLKDTEYVPKDWETWLKRLKCEPEHGKRIYWAYKEDVEFFKGEDVELSYLYSGILIAKPDASIHAHDVEDFIVVCDEYPVEKCDCDVDWIALSKLMDNDTLHEIVDKEKNYGSKK